MKNRNLTAIIVALLMVVVAAPALAAQVQIDIWTLNDFHGAILESKENPGIAKDAGYYLARKAENPAGTIFLNAGDLYQGSIESNLTYGRSLAEIMNYLQLDAMAVGNHEFDWGIEQLLATEKVAKFPYLACNVYQKADMKPVTWAKPYTILERKGVKIAVIGAAAADTADTTKPNYVSSLVFANPAVRINELAADLRKKGADVVIVLAHMGAQMQPDGSIIGDGADLLRKLKGVDLYVAGHWHNVVNGKINGVPIIAGYTYGRYMPHSRIIFDDKSRKIVSQSTDIIDTATLLAATPDPAVTQMVRRTEADVAKMSGEQLAVNKQILTNTDYNGKPLCILGEFITDVMRNTYHTDIAITNRGGIRTNLPAGIVTMQKLYAVLPFDNTVVTMELTGRQIEAILEHSISNCQFSGISVLYDATAPYGQRVQSVLMADGRILQSDRYYSVTTNDFLSNGGDGFSTFLQGKNLRDTRVTLRDCVAAYLRAHKIINYSYDKQRLMIIR